MLKFPLVEVNKISKVYTQHHESNNTFKDVESAKKFFITEQAIALFNKYCYRQEWQLTNHDRSLHWTISFKLDTHSTGVPNSDKWRDIKKSMTENFEWFVNFPVIDHDAKHLF
jgi:hypothetical protein